MTGVHTWWMVSRAAGIAAFAAMTVAVVLGLVRALRLTGPRWTRSVMALHEHFALAALFGIAVHGEALVGDHWLHPGIAGVLVPFQMSYRPVFVGLGVIGGWVAALLSLTFYARRRIGVKLWRRLHRFIVVAWLLSAVHFLGAGSDGGRPAVVAAVAALGGVIAALLALRIARPARAAQEGAPS